MSELPAVLLVSPQFPPCMLAGVHRARLLARRLPEHGWRPVVIRVDEAHYPRPLDEDLARLTSADLEQVRVGALPALPGFGDLGLRAFFQIGRAIDQANAKYAPKAVLFTGFPFYQMLHAGHVRRRLGLPVVLDFQDPWVSAYGASRPALSKQGLVHRLACALEPRILRHASFVTGVSEIQNAEMAARYPWLDASRMAAIPIGGDRADFEGVGGEPVDRGAGVELRYVGAYWPKAEPCVRQLLRGLALLREREPVLAKGLRISFTGTSAAGAQDRAVAALAAQEGVADLVEEHPSRVPFTTALRLMAGASGLVLFGSDEPHYTASKIYPVLMSGRPYLSLFHADSSAHQVLASAGGGIALGFAGTAELASLTPAIAEGLARLAAAPQTFAPADPAAYARYTAGAVAGRFADIFRQVGREAGRL